jgi:hypothetical protein
MDDWMGDNMEVICGGVCAWYRGLNPGSRDN